MAQCASFSDQTNATTNGVLTIGRMVNPIQVGNTVSIPGAGGTTPQNVIDSYNYASQQAGGPATSPCIALLNQASNFAATHPYGNEAGSTGVIQPTYMPYDELPAPCFNPVVQQIQNTFVPLPGPTGFAITTSPRAPLATRTFSSATTGSSILSAPWMPAINLFTSNATRASGV